MKSKDVNKVDLTGAACNFSFQQQKGHITAVINNVPESPFPLDENSFMDNRHAAETATKIIAAKWPVTNQLFCRYLKDRCTNKNEADKQSYEAKFLLGKWDKKYVAINLKSTDGEDELKSEFFRLSSATKFIIYSNYFNANNRFASYRLRVKILIADNQFKIGRQNRNSNSKKKGQILEQKQAAKQVKAINDFEEAFYFLSGQTQHQNQQYQLTSFLALKYLSCFEKFLLSLKNISLPIPI